MHEADSGGVKVRLDKWLWAARFFKTRSLASSAITGGKVHLNDQRTKPAHPVRPDDRLEIRRGSECLTVIVQALSDRRGPASEAAKLYQETAGSIATREAQSTKRRLAALAAPQPPARPDKKARRQIIRFTRRQD